MIPKPTLELIKICSELKRLYENVSLRDRTRHNQLAPPMPFMSFTPVWTMTDINHQVDDLERILLGDPDDPNRVFRGRGSNIMEVAPSSKVPGITRVAGNVVFWNIKPICKALKNWEVEWESPQNLDERMTCAEFLGELYMHLRYQMYVD